MFDNLKWDNIVSRSASHIEAKIVTRSRVWEGETVRIESQQQNSETIEVAVHSRSNTGLEDGINCRNVLLAVDQVQWLSR